MFNPLKFKIRVKIIIGIILALFISFLFIPPKQNNIPSVPVALLLNLTQLNNNTLTLKKIEVVERYSPDYQTDLQNNYYLIQIKKNDSLLFQGKMPKKEIIIKESLMTNSSQQLEIKNLDDFELYLPYFENATTLLITEDSGKVALNVDLALKKLKMPELKNTCGDGICTDNENLLMCYSDCKYLLPKWLPK